MFMYILYLAYHADWSLGFMQTGPLYTINVTLLVFAYTNSVESVYVHVNASEFRSLWLLGILVTVHTLPRHSQVGTNNID